MIVLRSERMNVFLFFIDFENLFNNGKLPDLIFYWFGTGWKGYKVAGNLKSCHKAAIWKKADSTNWNERCSSRLYHIRSMILPVGRKMTNWVSQSYPNCIKIIEFLNNTYQILLLLIIIDRSCKRSPNCIRSEQWR